MTASTLITFKVVTDSVLYLGFAFSVLFVLAGMQISGTGTRTSLTNPDFECIASDLE